ncbi:YrvL family regulatory protein [Oceanobacillus neutriphilus]|uniref:Regulatory protein YrvL n=1 Tax=Oceanobacillus neutriphilus TaxID=531815 RepID=A0ABQ2P1U2_9BACI|nr:YrvL family regulatory protein [Oceanobacillus neutriphilus]GGP16063.1 hypothetical protein GCM10011346_46540 [Oceanobacillus neutriphilus]
MSENENDSFRDKNVKEKIAIIIGITLLIIFAMGFVFGLYFFGLAGIFKLLGVQYDSIWSLLLFVIIMFIVSGIFEIFAKLIFMLSVRNITEKTTVLIVRIMIEFTLNWLVLFTVDEFMSSITLSAKTEIIIALLITVIEIVFDDDKDEDDDEKDEDEKNDEDE